MEEKSSKNRGGKGKWFSPNTNYTTICIYALLVIMAAIFLGMLVINWVATKAFIIRLVEVLSPFLAAVLIAYFLMPLVAKFESLFRKNVGKNWHPRILRYVSMLLAYVLVLGFVIVAFVFVIPQIGESLQELTASIPAMYERVAQWLTKLQEKYPEIDFEGVADRLNDMVPDLVNYGTNLVGSLVPMLYSLSMSLVRVVINAILAIMISVYMIASKEFFRHQLKRLIYALLNEKQGDILCKTCRECNDIFSAFLLSKAVDSLIIGCLCCVIMSVIGLPYAVLISVIVGITNMIPYFGPFIGAVPGVLIYLCTNPADAIVFAIMILILQQFDGLVLGPRLLGQSTGLNPIWVIFAITVGGAYFGVLGMFIGVPVVAVIAFLLNKWIVFRLHNKKIHALEEFKTKK